jgi:hypothetical protein
MSVWINDMIETANDPTKTDLDVGIACIDVSEETRLDCQGGYPADILPVRGLVFVASVNHNDAPRLSIYTEEGIADLGAQVRQAITEGEDEDQLHELIGECLETAAWKGEEESHAEDSGDC